MGATPMSAKQTVLVVDDTPENIDVLSGVLRDTYKVKVAANGEKALRIAGGDPKPDIILLDIMMPEMDGYEVCRRLKADPVTAPIPVIFVTAKTEVADEQMGFELGAVDYITKPISPSIVKARVHAQLALYDQSRELGRLVAERTSELNETRLAVISRLGRAAEFKDNETGLHVIRMSRYSQLIAEAIRVADDWAELLLNAAPMHDIGKIGIPDRILQKPAKLDADEWAIMQRHPAFGAEIIGDHPSDLLQLSREIALAHHEKWNGSGYPQGLAGADIPIAARIVAIADVFDALTTERPYKKAWSVEDAVKLIDEGAGQHFDPTLVGAFHEVLEAILQVKDTYAEAHAPRSAAL
ncbi:MAG: two-component system response regulator [Halochromatium sp.]|nr:two-component system response regulator [Halochromatium sp.]